MTDDVLIIGAGVIGLSLAYELSGHGLSVRLIDRAAPAREASWAGAGILPPAKRGAVEHPYEDLAGLSHELLPRWTEQLREETGIDNGLRRWGAVHLATTPEEAERLEAMAALWQARQVVAEPLSTEALQDREAAVATEHVLAAYHLPEEAQIRNPRHLKALLVGCTRRGVHLEAGCEAQSFHVAAGRIRHVHTSRGKRAAGAVCIAAGAWSRAVVDELKLTLTIKPVRGQIVLLTGDRPLHRHIINRGSRYIVPRPDGRILVGSTEDDVGFDKRTTAEGIRELLNFACELIPALGQLEVERCWAGLRPQTSDGFPYLGRVPELENAFVAAGHFRAGLTLSPATAVVMSQLIRGEQPEVDLRPFRVDRA